MVGRAYLAIAVIATAEIIFAFSACKAQRTNTRSNVQSEIVNLPTGVIEAADAHIILENGIGREDSIIVGARASRIPANIVFVDKIGNTVRSYPIYLSIAEGFSFGNGEVVDFKMDLDLWDGKSVEQLLGKYWGGTLGVNLLFGGGGVDFAVNGNGVYLGNADFQYRGVMGRIGIVYFSLEKRDDQRLRADWKWSDIPKIENGAHFEASRTHRRRAWILDQTVDRSGYVGKVAIERDAGDPSAFHVEAMVISPDHSTYYAPTKLNWNADNQTWDNQGSLFNATMRVNFTREGESDICYLRFGKALENRVSGSCAGYRAFLRMWCGDKTHC